MKRKVRIIAIMNSGEAFDLARDAGVDVGPVPPGSNTFLTPFKTRGGRAALLIQQVGFGVRKGEKSDDVNGLTALVADAADFPAGRDALAVVTSGILNDRPLTVGAVPDDTTAIDTGAL